MTNTLRKTAKLLIDSADLLEDIYDTEVSRDDASAYMSIIYNRIDEAAKQLKNAADFIEESIQEKTNVDRTNTFRHRR